MSKNDEPRIVIVNDSGEPYYASLTEIALLCERDEHQMWKLENDWQDDDYDGYG